MTHLDFRSVRRHTDHLTEPLSAEDQTIQSMPDVSPTKWHRGHTTWFFETFLLLPHAQRYAAIDDSFAYLFNSYYESVGERHPRAQRGLITRPSVDEVDAYRRQVDASVLELMAQPGGDRFDDIVQLGLHHEQQHQELLLMDIHHVLANNPSRPAYRSRPSTTSGAVAVSTSWRSIAEGLYEIGHDGCGFAFDHEAPRHRAWLESFEIADRLVTCGEWESFIADDGYRRPELWMSQGWATILGQRWSAPMYWERNGDEWWVKTLDGFGRIEPDEPVAHISWYEADAFARWSNARLPTETEWEVAATGAPAHLDMDRTAALRARSRLTSTDQQWHNV